MRRKFLGVLGMVLLVACLSGISAFAQKHRITVDVSFKFSAAGETFAPGRYEITADPLSVARLRIRSLPDGEVKVLNYMTRLGAKTDGKPQLVFDREGDTAYLTEIHMPGMDGYYLKGAPGEHKHTTVQGSGQ